MTEDKHGLRTDSLKGFIMDMMPFSYKSRQSTQGGEWAKRHGSKFVPQQVRGPLHETECATVHACG